jgi:hypothetical protein
MIWMITHKVRKVNIVSDSFSVYSVYSVVSTAFSRFNDYLGNDRRGQRQLCDEVTQALLENKRNRPGIRMVGLSTF